MAKIKYHKKIKVDNVTYYFLYGIKESKKGKYKIYIKMNSKPKSKNKIKFENLPKNVQKIYKKMMDLVKKQFKHKKRLKGIPKETFGWVEALKEYSKLKGK